MAWDVYFDDDFAQEFRRLDPEVKVELRAMVLLLETHGPRLGRPWADTLKGSRFANMKELRFMAARGVWRVAFAFDPTRSAIVLIAGDKSGKSQANFYKKLIEMADIRYSRHIASLGKGRNL